MKIVYINHDYNISSGGVATYLARLYPALEERGIEVVVIYGEKSNGLHGAKRKAYYIPDIHRFRTKENKELTKKAMEVITAENPDIVHMHNTDNFFLDNAVQKAGPLIRTVHTHAYSCPSAGRYLKFPLSVCQQRSGWQCFSNYFIRRCWNTRSPHTFFEFTTKSHMALGHLRSLPAVIVASKAMKECLLQSRLKEEQVKVLPYFTDMPQEYAAGGENIILFSGRICREKGLDLLIRALKFVNLDFKFIVAGSGREMDHCRSLSDKSGLGNRVEFIDWKDDLSKYYQAASVIIMPSIWPEPFGIVGIEAMSYGRPVIAFDVGAAAEWLEDGKTGFLIHPYDIKQMAEKIELLLKDKDLAGKMGKEGRRIAEKKFDEENHISALLAITEETIRQSKK